MKLMTQEVKSKLPNLYANEGIDPEDISIAVKYFNPVGVGTWYITEFDGEDTLFGLCCIHEPELGYVSLKELEKLRFLGGIMKVERDLYYTGTLRDAMSFENYPNYWE